MLKIKAAGSFKSFVPITKLHGIISFKAAILIFKTVKTLDFINLIFFVKKG
jgi:hypothetical protein